MADVLISEFMDKRALIELKEDYDVHWDPDLWQKRDELFTQIASARAIIVRNATQVDAELLSAAPNLKIVARMGVGLDNINLEICDSLGVKVCPAIGANAASVAEYVIATALILLRGKAFNSTDLVIAGKWDRQSFTGGLEIGDRTLGIIGFGSIGQVVGKKAKAMDMNVKAYDAILPKVSPVWREAERVDFYDLIESSDIVTLHCPLLPETRGLIGKKEIVRMKKGAVLINSARGGIVDEAACADALKSGHLGGAALDTLETEPITDLTCRLFAGIENLILTPHIAGVTKDSNKRIADVAVSNVRRILKAPLKNRIPQ